MLIRFLISLVLAPSFVLADMPIKQPNVAGGFYSSNRAELSRDVEAYLNQASIAPVEGAVPLAIAPHAGYIYSGAVAGYTFKALAQKTYSTIIVMAPSHHFPFSNAAIWSKGSFATPLGQLPVDEVLAQLLLAQGNMFGEQPEVFAKEHALEVELPFIQNVWPQAKIVPMLLGQADFKTCEAIAVAMQKVLAGRSDVLVLVSTDLSHYHPYDQAKAIDQRTLAFVQNGDIEGFWKGMAGGSLEMCGYVPVTVAMMLAKLDGLDARVLKYANSGDTAGDKKAVVGYGSIVFAKPSEDLSAAQKDFLISLAKQAVHMFVGQGKRVEAKSGDARLNRIQGAFVTLTKNGQLRGCIGDIIGHKPLVETVRDMAISAASEDPRFPPVTAQELKDISVEVSILSNPKRVQGAQDIVMGRDGVIISDGGSRQGVFLPQVATETGWSKEEFLSELASQKAGLPADAWKNKDIQLFTFTAQVFGEHE